MKASSLQFSFGVSVVCHAAVFGVIAVGGFSPFQSIVGSRVEAPVITLTLAEGMDKANGGEAVTANEPIVSEPAPPPPPSPKSAAVEPPLFIPPFEKTPVAEPAVLQPAPVDPAPQGPPSTVAVIEVPAKPSPVQELALNSTPSAQPVLVPSNASKPSSDAVTTKGTLTVRAQPNYRRNPEPPYPLTALRRRQQGVVLLDVQVSAQGRATQVEVKVSSGFALLDDTAVRAVLNWDFEPARIGPIPMDSKIEVPVRFQLGR